MTEPREYPRVGPEDVGEEARPSRSRGFARLVESPAARRLALPKLASAAAIVLLTVAVLGVIVLGLARSGGHWVASRPEYAIPFADIELQPPPDAWIEGGKARILEQFRIEAKLGPTVSLLELNLKEFRRDFQRCPWVKKVHRVDRTRYRRLLVQVSFRKPVAVVVLKKAGRGIGYVIDEEAVPLPDGDIHWTAQEPRFRVRGIADPLIEIRGVDPAVTPRNGVPWKRPDAADSLDGRGDARVLGAARLAEFLQRQPKTSPAGRSLPDFVSIWLSEESDDFFLRDTGQNWVHWGKAPGEEKPGTTTAPDKWRMLAERVERVGPLEAKGADSWRFGRSEMEFVPGRPRLPRTPGAR